jgi:transketolase
VAQGWHRYVGDRGDVLGIERFGASAPADILMREYGFTVDNVVSRARAVAVDYIDEYSPERGRTR